MHPPGPPTTDPAATNGKRGRVSGRRAIVEFSPGLTSTERLCAGVVLQLNDGTTTYRVAVDATKAEHGFGAAGANIAALASRLCASLADHWLLHADGEWKPPFEGARIARVAEFTASDAAAAMSFALRQHSSLHTLLAGYEVASQARTSSIVQRVRTAVRREERSKHLAPRFVREVNLGDEAGLLRVDFLGQHFACYFVALTHSARGIEPSTERAFGKLFELQALRRFILRKRKNLGLLEDEKPERFELLTVGDRSQPAEGRAYARIEALADRREVIVRPVANVSEAAQHVAVMERKAA